MFKVTVINEYDNIVVLEVLNLKDDRESFEANIDYEFQNDKMVYRQSTRIIRI